MRRRHNGLVIINFSIYFSHLVCFPGVKSIHQLLCPTLKFVQTLDAFHDEVV